MNTSATLIPTKTWRLAAANTATAARLPHPKGQAMSDTKEMKSAEQWFHEFHKTRTYSTVEFFRMIQEDAIATRPPSPALKVAREALEKCKSECSCGAMGCVGHDDTCPVHLKQNALALLAKEGV
jgi:hypothetical protein